MAVSPCRIAAHATYHSRWNVQPTRGTAGRLGPHHMEGLNLIFADGHAKWQKVFPEDCHAWVPVMPAGVRKVTDPTTLGCNPMNTTGTGNSATGQWCGNN